MILEGYITQSVLDFEEKTKSLTMTFRYQISESRPQKQDMNLSWDKTEKKKLVEHTF